MRARGSVSAAPDVTLTSPAEKRKRLCPLSSSRQTLRQRVKALTRLRTEEGYMAETRRNKDGSFTLIENHCPICAAAELCQGLCSGELELFTKALGKGVQVERTEHLMDGARRCVYRITRTPRSR